MSWSPITNLFTNPPESEHVYSDGKNGFLIITTFSNEPESGIPSANNMSNYMNEKDGSIVFSPNGSLFRKGKYLYKNPITPEEVFNTSWPAVDREKYMPWTDELPNFILSYQGRWILCDDTKKSGNWYLLYNPINTSKFTWDNRTFGDYCEFIQFQDPGCYCANYPGHAKACSYAVFPSKKDAIPFVDSTQTTFKNVQAQQNLNSNCGCNNICKDYRDGVKTESPAQYQNVKCDSMVSSVFCNSGPIAQTGGSVNVPGLQISQNCGGPGIEKDDSGSNQSTPSKPPSSAPDTSFDNKMLIVGAILLIIFVIIFIIINVK